MLKDIGRAMLIGVIVIGGGYVMAISFAAVASMAGLWYALAVVGWLAFVLFVAAFLGAGKDMSDVAFDDLEHPTPMLAGGSRADVGGDPRRAAAEKSAIPVRPLSPFYDQHPVRSFDQPAAKGFRAEAVDRRAVEDAAIRNRQVRNLHYVGERARLKGVR